MIEYERRDTYYRWGRQDCCLGDGRIDMILSVSKMKYYAVKDIAYMPQVNN